MKKTSIVLTMMIVFLSLIVFVSAVDNGAITIVGVRTSSAISTKSSGDNIYITKTAKIINDEGPGYVDVKLTAQTKKGQSKNPKTGDEGKVIPIMAMLVGCAILASLMKKKVGKALLVLALLLAIAPMGAKVLFAEEIPTETDSAECGVGQDDTSESVNEVDETKNNGNNGNGNGNNGNNGNGNNANCGNGQDGTGEGCGEGNNGNNGNNGNGNNANCGNGQNGTGQGCDVDDTIPNDNGGTNDVDLTTVYSSRDVFTPELIANFDFVEVTEVKGAVVEYIVENNKVVGFTWHSEEGVEEVVIEYRLALKTIIDEGYLGSEIVISNETIKYIDSSGKDVRLVFPTDLAVKLYVTN